MTELYVPAPGERVRVVALHEAWQGFGDTPEVDVGTEHTVGRAYRLAFYEEWISLGSGRRVFYCRVEPVAKCACTHERITARPDGSLRCADCDAPHDGKVPSARRFCACGQELMGERLKFAYLSPTCGDCAAGKTYGDSLDARIRAAQPETEEHAFERGVVVSH